jgi:plasmid stability protein
MSTTSRLSVPLHNDLLARIKTQAALHKRSAGMEAALLVEQALCANEAYAAAAPKSKRKAGPPAP